MYNRCWRAQRQDSSKKTSPLPILPLPIGASLDVCYQHGSTTILRSLQSKIASYREGRKAMSANIFGKDQRVDEDAAAVPPKNNMELQNPGEADYSGIVGGSGADGTPKSSGKQMEGSNGWGGGRYAVTGGVARAGFGAGEQGGRRRHDLLLVRALFFGPKDICTFFFCENISAHVTTVESVHSTGCYCSACRKTIVGCQP